MVQHQLLIKPRRAGLALAALALCQSGWSAPLDALLNVDELPHRGTAVLEFGSDVVNDTVDIFHVRSNDASYAGTNVGDYHGLHLGAGYALTDNLALKGLFWKRRISYHEDVGDITSWQVSSQLRLWGDATSPAALAVRLGAWGNASQALTKSSSTIVSSRTVTDVVISNVSDLQQQLDIVGTWRFSGQTALNVLTGLAASTVKTGPMTARYTSSAGCHYLLTYASTGFGGALTEPCNSKKPILESFQSSENVVPDFSYRSRMLHLGANLQWHDADWHVKAGYQYQHWYRGRIDAAMASAGSIPVTSNHILIGEVDRLLSGQTSIFLRGQYMTNQFLGEIPFAYNLITASKFNRRYGLLMLGVRVDF
jgi:hypothetical protein